MLPSIGTRHHCTASRVAQQNCHPICHPAVHAFATYFTLSRDQVSSCSQPRSRPLSDSAQTSKQASVSIRLPDPIYHRGQVTLIDNECGRNLYDAFQVKTLSSVTVTDLCRPLISTFVQPVSLVQILIHILANIGKSVSRLSSERSRRGRLVNLRMKPPGRHRLDIFMA